MSSAPTVHEDRGSASEIPKRIYDTICVLNGDERRLTVTPKAVGCVLHYSKFGQATRIASSKVSGKHCEEVRLKVKRNLARAGFSCD